MAVSFAKRRVSRSMKIGLISTPTTSETPNKRADRRSRPPPTPITAPVWRPGTA
jgi:hypothetical protein